MRKNNPADTPDVHGPADTEGADNTVQTDAAETGGVQLEAQLDEMRDRYLRLAAEYDNYRKRSQKEREAAYGDAVSGVVSALLPILDNLDLAVAQETEDAAYKKGVEMTHKVMLDCFTKLGVTEIAAQGEAFNPELHDAVMHVEDERCDDNTVVEVLKKGYVMGERVIRHAMVKVAN